MRRAMIVIVLIAAVAACSTTKQADLQVRVEHDDATDFSAWKTYRFATTLSESDGQTRYKAVENEARSAIESNLADRGYQRIEDGIPDFRIAFGFASRGDRGTDLDRGYGADPAAPPVAQATKTNTLTVRMLDPVTSEILWEGRVAGFAIDAIGFKAEIENAVWRLFVEFPPITR